MPLRQHHAPHACEDHNTILAFFNQGQYTRLPPISAAILILRQLPRFELCLARIFRPIFVSLCLRYKNRQSSGFAQQWARRLG